ncbi:radical SAM protein [Nostoc sp. CALU 1950]|uniref:radical SAM protein n=1 Tax=Nostoc sp. CALU 1950 TaxID=3104321 RepID=UPI003EBA61DE
MVLKLLKSSFRFVEIVSKYVIFSLAMLLRSSYNYFVDRSDGVMGYNARTGTFALLNDDAARMLRGNSPLDSVQNEEKLIEELIHMGFLHFGDEKVQIHERFNQARQQSNLVLLTLTPTLACNFSCDYCYQSDYRVSRIWSSETQVATLRFISHLLEQGRKDVFITWYGGEPLLAKSIVLRFSEQVRELIKTSGGKLHRLEMVTNGTLLNRKVAEELKNVGISEIQISLDSLFFKHPNKRGILNQSGMPSIILQNIVNARDILKITIRINVSPTNEKDIDKIQSFLNELGFAGSYYFARVDSDDEDSQDYSIPEQPVFATKDNSLVKVNSLNTNTNCTSCHASGSATLDRKLYAIFEQQLLERNCESWKLLIKKLTPKKHFCSATTGAMFVIDPDGYINRCWRSAGQPEEAIGSVHDEMPIYDHHVEKTWLGYSPFSYSDCSECKVLPLCMGGCSYPRLFKNAKTAPCTAIRDQIDYCVNEVGRRLTTP